MMIDKVDNLTPIQIWETALGELQLQLAESTYTTWLKRSRLVSGENGDFVVAAHNEYAKDWLESKLTALCNRTLTGIAGHPVQITFITDTEKPAQPEEEIAPAEEIVPDPHPATPIEWDPSEIGFFPVDVYAGTFWRPYLTRRSRYAWAIWEVVRAEDKRTKKDKAASPWTPPATWSAPELAELVGCGIQAVAGVTRAEHGRQPGAMECLTIEGVGRFTRQGKYPHVDYEISVKVMLPVLRPDQARKLAIRLCTRHDRFLRDHEIDPTPWIEARRMTL